jgi:hypothetical protein
MQTFVLFNSLPAITTENGILNASFQALCIIVGEMFDNLDNDLFQRADF